MAHFAELDETNIVKQVIVVHNNELLDENNVEQEQKGIGSTYDPIRDAFIAPKPYPSWILNEDTCQLEAPVPYPTDGKFYTWDEETTSWIEIPTITGGTS